MNAPLNSKTELKITNTQLIQKTQNIRRSSWQAHLRLSFAKRQRGVRLVNSEHEGPLYVQKAFYPEGPDCAHVYLLHPPGGLVTGDTLSIDVTAQTGSHVLLTTPGAGRVYKMREQGGVQTQNLKISIDENAVVEWFPLETILFPSSHARMNTQIHLEGNAVFMGWEVTCFGLPANSVRFDTGSLNQKMQIWREGRILVNESLVIDEDDASLLSGNAGLRGHPVHALMLAGPFTNTDQTDLLEQLRQISTESLFAISLVGEFMAIRYLGACTEEARNLLTEAWKLIRPVLINKPATEPRIWAT